MAAPSSLLGLALRGLTDAARTTAPGVRYALAHLAALSGGRGTYDLCFSWRTGWTLKRVLD
jgi:hypothetical protein